ncbi:unnamed protein product [Brachionus calyciflorus]|uniref:Uncharacterized protein n=1 Tax=Brachionus calyciflorus TaxID=104777 RepID=A0A813NXL9_9BILA|nr:unnamed protein product [Brachionus calyciflorus]
MIKLVDYFVVVGYESSSSSSTTTTGQTTNNNDNNNSQLIDDQEQGSNGRAKIIQRFPLDDDEFDSNIHCFCQPHKGWYLYTKQESPTFFVSVLTDIKGQRRYSACLTFLEPFQNKFNKNLNNQSDCESLLNDSEYPPFESTTTSCNTTDEQPIQPSKLYSAKSLVLISRLEYTDLFKNCLSQIYAIYVDKRHNSDNKLLERVLSKLLTQQVPSPGTALSIQFSLGADDKHYVQSQASLTVPSTANSVYKLFKEIGIANVLNLVCSIMADFKILFFSKSYNKLYEACRALESLLFPLKYTGVYVPVLPCFGSFLEFPAAPTPYIIGVHSSFRNLIEQMHTESLGECVKVDLDSGLVNIPLMISELISSKSDDKPNGLPTYLYESTLNLLYYILKRDVLHPDELINNTNNSSSSSNDLDDKSLESSEVYLDKMIRSVFVRMFAQLFAGYRYCLLIIRINPKPVICFNKASFLSNHNLLKNDFMNRLLDSMSFQKFIEERGPSYRNCDVFDDLYADIQSHLQMELKEQELDLNATNSSYYSSSTSLIYTHLKEIADKLLTYEFPMYKIKYNNNNTNKDTNRNPLLNTSVQSYSKIKHATQDAYKRLHSESFPHLDASEIKRLIKENLSKTESISDLSSNSLASLSSNPKNNIWRPHLVPYGPPIETVQNLYLISRKLVNINEKIELYPMRQQDMSSSVSSPSSSHVDSCQRKLDTIENFIHFIFENNFKEAKKNLNSAFRALRTPKARLHLCTILQSYVKKNQVILNSEQFEYVCKLLNDALENDTRLDEHGVAYYVLPLTSAFYRKLNNNTIDQCIYTRLQQHDVWSNMLFWEMAFYTDVQRSIRPVYLSNEEFAAEQDHQLQPNENAAQSNGLYFRPNQKTALEICGEQMEKSIQLTDEQKENFIRNEQGIIRSHVLHYITQMVNMKIPLDINERMKKSNDDNSQISTPSRSQSFDMTNSKKQQQQMDLVSSLNQSICSDNDSIDDEPIAQDPQPDDVNYESWKFISKFVDRVCIEGYLSETQKNLLHQNLADVIRMQIEMLDLVYTHSKLVPLRHKPKLDQLKPENILNGEFIIDPSPLRCYLVPDGRDEYCGLPTLGHILIPAEGALYLTNYRLIFRGIPINDSLMSDAIITRSFPISALIKEKKIGSNYKLINADLNNLILSNGLQMRSSTFQLLKIYFDESVHNEKIERFRMTMSKYRYPLSIYEVFSLSNSNRFIPNQTTVRIKEVKMDKQQTDTFRTFAKSTLRKAGLMSKTKANRTPELNRKFPLNSKKSVEEDSDQDQDNLDTLSIIEENFDYAYIYKMIENNLSYCDYIRQGLINDDELELRVCTLNMRYELSKSLPSLFLVPRQTSDECLRKNAKSHRLNRLPILVWRHPKLKSIILRGSGFQGKGFLGALIKTSTTTTTNQNNNNFNHHTNNNIILTNDQKDRSSGGINATTTTTNMEQDKYMNEILKLTNFDFVDLVSGNHNNSSNSNNVSKHSYSMTPVTNRRSVFASKLEKAVQTIKNNYNLASSNSNSNGLSNTTQHVPSSNSHFNSSNKFNTISSSYNSSKLNIKNNQNFSNPSYNTSFDLAQPMELQQHHQMDNLSDSFNDSIASSNNYPIHQTRLNSNVSDASSNKYFNAITNSKRSTHQPSPLYIICEKSQVKSLRPENTKDTSRYIFIPIDTHEVKDTKNSFKKLCRACLPSNSFIEAPSQSHNHHNTNKMSSTSFALNRLTSSNKITRKKSAFNEPHIPNVPSNSFLKQINDSKWFDQIQLIINIANTIVDKIEEGSSVMLCLEDGWDLTSQIVSLAELLLDPFYRTLEGFSLLIEREWLSMGHRFTRRNNQTADDQTGFAPIFIQFLDCVHQCLNQSPQAFEFNYFYLEFLAYHSVSNRFSTFLLDNEYERVQHGILKTDFIARKNFNTDHTIVTYKQYKSISSETRCIWDYILKVHYNSAKFFNFNYQPGLYKSSALRLGSEFCKLKLWKYYVKESLSTGPLYDYDLVNTANYMSSKSESWYPMGVQVARDYYEQLNEILPSQYEVLLKQIITKYKLDQYENECENEFKNSYISSLLSRNVDELGDNVNMKAGYRINWKCLWDYFFNLAEQKMLNDLMVDDELVADYGNCFISVTKPYLACLDDRSVAHTSHTSQIVQNKHLTLMSSYSHSSKNSSSTNYSTSTSSAISSTPPFPKLINSKNSNQKLNRHEFEMYVFSSINICNLCNSNFKSNTEYIGLKCHKCNINCHEYCKHEFELIGSPIIFECLGNTGEYFDHYQQQGQILGPNIETHLESSSFCVNTNTSISSSSCSTTPNSHYSSKNNFYEKPRPQSNSFHQYSITNRDKMDADIGSACAVGLKNKDLSNDEDNKKTLANTNNQTVYNNENKDNYKNLNWSNIDSGDSTSKEHQTYAGYLKKQGALFKQWKERYFVLDSVKHQLRYYDSANDLNCPKGIIDLSEVEYINEGITMLQNQNIEAKKMVNLTNLIADITETNSKSCFELKTSKRVYYFLAKSPQEAFKWVKQLEMCCLDS